MQELFFQLIGWLGVRLRGIFYVAKCNLGKVKHELMQLASVPNQQLSVRQVNLELILSAVFPFRST